MKQERKEQFLEVVEQARKGDEVAKGVLLVILETERKPTILWKLDSGDVRPQDRLDALHDIEIKVYESIEDLRVRQAYFAWGARIVKEFSRHFRKSYCASGESLDDVFTEV
jgi:hypothetical protein